MEREFESRQPSGNRRSYRDDHELARFDLDVLPAIEVEGARCHRVLRCETTYASALAPCGSSGVCIGTRMTVTPSVRWELAPGIIECAWTPLAAKQATWVVAHVTPKRVKTQSRLPELAYG